MEKSAHSTGERDFTGTLKKLKEQAAPKEAELIEVVSSMYEGLKNTSHEAKDKIVHASERINESIHDHPWYYVGGAAVLGFVLGLSARCRH